MWKITPDSELLEISQDGEQDSPSSAASSTVWLASEFLTLTQATVPPKQKALNDKMVAFMLEDKMLEPIEKLHFALGVVQSGELPVVVASSQNMQKWVGLCKEQGITPHALLPDLYALPFEQGRMTLWHEGDRCLLRTGQHSGVAGSLDWVLGVAQLADKASDSHSTELDIYSDAVERLPEAWRQSARPLLAPLDEMMLRYKDSGAVNLFQGAHALKSPLNEWLVPWKSAAMFALFAIALHIALMVFETARFDARADMVEQDTIKLFKSIDKDGAPNNIRQQVTQYFQLLQERKVKSDQNAWSIFTMVDGALSRCRLCTVETLALDGNKLRLRIKAKGDFQALKEEIAAIEAIKSQFKVLKKGQDHSIVRFNLSLRDG